MGIKFILTEFFSFIPLLLCIGLGTRGGVGRFEIEFKLLEQSQENHLEMINYVKSTFYSTLNSGYRAVRLSPCVPACAPFYFWREEAFSEVSFKNNYVFNCLKFPLCKVNKINCLKLFKKNSIAMNISS